MITSEKIKNLRLKTGAGMMDCKKALEEVNGDIDSAVDWLRKKGISTAQKKSSRDASEGLITISINGNTASIVEVNSETDFVARNNEFQIFCKQVSEIIAKNKIQNLEDLNLFKINDGAGLSVSEELTSLISKVGENLIIKRCELICEEKTFVQKYLHNSINDSSGKIGVIMQYTACEKFNDDKNISKNICMHIAATDPKSMTSNDLDEKIIEREKAIYREQLVNSGKPTDIIEKIILGKINKFYEDVCLDEQFFVMENKIKIKDYIQNYNKKFDCNFRIKSFKIFKVGESS